MSKLFIDKKETISSITERIAHASSDRVTLVIPRGSKLGEGNHLESLRKHAVGEGKTLVIESIDERILELAEKHGLEKIHPLFEGERRQTFSDIRSHRAESIEEEKVDEEEADKEDDDDVPKKNPHREATLSIESTTKKRRFSLIRFPSRRPKVRDYIEEDVEEYESSEGRPPRRTKYIVGGIIVVLLIILSVGWGVGKALGRVEILVILKKTPWQSEVSLLADKSLNALKANSKTIPAMLFTEKKNTTQLFKASGREETSQKATAKVIIYNAYDSKPQTLVATTRLATPDDKIFRLDKQVIVPGAKLENGKITPTGIEATVTADQPGAEYNVGPFDKLTIVGFKGTPRYEGFYAVMKEKATGGLVGEAPVPTDEDIKKAEEKTRSTIESALDLNIRRRIPEEFKILKEATAVEISKLQVNKGTDDQGNFNVMGEGQLSVIAFRESDLQMVLGEMTKVSHPDLIIKTVAIAYETVKPNFSGGTMTMNIKAEAVLTSPFDADSTKAELSGKSVKESRTYLSNLSGLERAKIDIWPPWLWSLPSNTNQITITTD